MGTRRRGQHAALFDIGADGVVPARAFGFMADVDVVVRAGPRRLVLRYAVEEWEAPRRLLLVARTATLRSVDEIRVEPADGGAVVTYDARLDLRGLLSAGNPLLSLVFRRVGDRAAAGLRSALGGESP